MFGNFESLSLFAAVCYKAKLMQPIDKSFSTILKFECSSSTFPGPHFSLT